MFGVKLGWVSLFGGLLLIGFIVFNIIWQVDWFIVCYDVLVIYVVVLQVVFFVLYLEIFFEVKVILLFYIIGMVMEIFKFYMGSWDYFGEGLLKIVEVFLFLGFMYVLVGSFLVCVICLFDMWFIFYLFFWMSVVLVMLIYVNFFMY